MILTSIDKYTNQSIKEYLMNKTVECVKESRSIIMPTIVSWYGETVDGYFQSSLVGGGVMMSFSEREYQIKFGMSQIHYIGGIESILESLVNLKGNSLLSYVSDIDTLNKLTKLTKEVKFQDVMGILNWKFKNDNIQIENLEFGLS